MRDHAGQSYTEILIARNLNTTGIHSLSNTYSAVSNLKLLYRE